MSTSADDADCKDPGTTPDKVRKSTLGSVLSSGSSLYASGFDNLLNARGKTRPRGIIEDTAADAHHAAQSERDARHALPRTRFYWEESPTRTSIRSLRPHAARNREGSAAPPPPSPPPPPSRHYRPPRSPTQREREAQAQAVMQMERSASAMRFMLRAICSSFEIPPRTITLRPQYGSQTFRLSSVLYCGYRLDFLDLQYLTQG
ncbi:hypothetical protein B0H14DRAFT_2580135 [Mycena olivaceomarginata]|nr:hypothetical protein B0H14DRAFT_2580135 [Mycena olivaceomarginata]